MSKIKSSLVWCIEESDAKDTNVLEVFKRVFDETKFSIRLGDVYDDGTIHSGKSLSKDEMDVLVDILKKLGYEVREDKSSEVKGMEIKITVFKESGKYYTSDVVKCDEDIMLFDDRFKTFVANNLPAVIGEGYVVVEDTETNVNQSFHTALYQYDEIKQFRTK